MLEHGACGVDRESIPWPGGARSVPKILSAGEPRRITKSIFAAFRRQKHEQKLAPR